MAIFGFRSKLKSMVKQALNIESDVDLTSSVSPQAVNEPAVSVLTPDPPDVAPEVEAAAPVEMEDVAPLEEPLQESAQTPSPQNEGLPLTLEAVQEILDEDVRPALQMDGGDISLVKIEDNNIYVKLVGACSTCPSSVMTMRMGVENLLREEFPSMKELIDTTVHEEETEEA